MRSLRRPSFAWLLALPLAGAACSSASPAEDAAALSASSAVTPVKAEVASAALQWSGWSSLSGGLVTDPAILQAGVLEYVALAVGPDGNLYSNWFRASQWYGWVNLGNAGNKLTQAPVAVIEYNGLTAKNDVIVIVQDTVAGTLLMKSGEIESGGPAPVWGSSFASLSAPNNLTFANTGRPPTFFTSQPGNQLNIFATLSDGTAGYARGFFGFLSWTSLSGGVLYQPGAASWGPNRLDTFVAGTDNHLYHRYSNDNGVTWYPAGGNWEYLGGDVRTTPQVVSWGANRLDVFVGGFPAEYRSEVEHLSWTGSSWGGTWCGAGPCWDALPYLVWDDSTNGVATPTPATLGAGQMEVFVQGYDHALDHITMVSPETATSAPVWGIPSAITSCFRTGGKPTVITPGNEGYDVAVEGFDPSGNTAIWVDSTNGDFGAPSGSPPACPAGMAGETCNYDSACAPASGGAVCQSNQICGCPTGTFAGQNGTCMRNVISVASSTGAALASTTVPTAGTYAYALVDGDLPGAAGNARNVTFTAGVWPPNQTVIAYDIPYGTGTNDEGGRGETSDFSVGNYGCTATHYVALSGGAGGQTLTASNVNLEHLIRYNDGTCRVRLPLTDIFPGSEASTVQQIQANVPGIASLDWFQVMQPHFRGRGSSMQPGFFLEGAFDVNVTGLGVGQLFLDPAYDLTPSSNGLVTAGLLEQNVSALGAFAGSLGKIETAVGTDQLKTIAGEFAGALVQPFATVLAAADPGAASLVPTSCNTPTPNAASQECLNNIQPLLQLAGASSGGIAAAAAAALTAENFSCDPVPGSTSGANQCDFHPIVQAVNVLPDVLELVISPSLATTGTDTLTPFYASLPASATSANVKVNGVSTTVNLDCSTLASGVKTGTITTIYSGDTNLADGMACGSIMTTK